MATLSEIAGLPQFAPAAPGQSGPQNVEKVADEAVSMLAARGRAEKTKAGPAFNKIQYKTDADGKTTVSVDMPEETYRNLSELAQTGQQARAAFGQAAAQLAQKREFLQANPVIAGVGRIASAAASLYAGNPRVAPLVQASGAFGADIYGQTPDQLAVEEAKLKAQEFQVHAAQTEAVEQARHRAVQEATTLEGVAMQRAQLDIAQGEAAAQNVERAVRDYEMAAASGNVEAMDGMLKDPVVLEAFGDDEAGKLKLQQKAQALRGVAQGFKVKLEEERKFQKELLTTRLNAEANLLNTRLRADKIDRQTAAKLKNVSDIDLQLSSLAGAKAAASAKKTMYASLAGVDPTKATNSDIIKGLQGVFAAEPDKLRDVITDLTQVDAALQDTGAREVSLRASRKAYMESLPEDEKGHLANIDRIASDPLGAYLYLKLNREATPEEYEAARKGAAAEAAAADAAGKQQIAESMLGQPGFFERYAAGSVGLKNEMVIKFLESVLQGPQQLGKTITKARPKQDKKIKVGPEGISLIK